MLIFPSPPGGICLGNETAVHPQPVRTLSMSSGVVPVLATTKSWVTVAPSITGGNSWALGGEENGRCAGGRRSGRCELCRGKGHERKMNGRDENQGKRF